MTANEWTVFAIVLAVQNLVLLWIAIQPRVHHQDVHHHYYDGGYEDDGGDDEDGETWTPARKSPEPEVAKLN